MSGAWAHSYTQRFVWGSSVAGSGWLMLMVVDGSVTLSPSAAERKFTWGRDLSGHGGGSSGSASCGGGSSGSASGGTGLQPVALLTGAGGIGGLLAVYDNDLAGTGVTTFQFAFMYDANGNVGQVNDYTQATAAAAMVAKYGYDAYGNVNSKSGTYADTNTIRCSTRFWDTETNLGYWGYRYYDAGLGRWISRDPIGEIGGDNLLLFCRNDGIRQIDALGEQASKPTGSPRGCTANEPNSNPTNEECCAASKKAQCDQGDNGGVVCCQKRKVSCYWGPRGSPGDDIIEACVKKHEDAHKIDVSCDSCPTGKICRPNWRNKLTPTQQDASECRAYKQGIDCAKERRRNCFQLPQNQQASCLQTVDAEIKFWCTQATSYCGAKPPQCK